jgi:hypothetical protein
MAPISAVLLVLFIALGIYTLAGTWKTYEKAGRPGWNCIIPFYSGWVLAEIGGKPGWWGLIGSVGLGYRINSTSDLDNTAFVIAAVIGIVSLVFTALIAQGVAQKFQKSTGFAFVLLFLPFIGYPILGFGPAKYKKSR